MAKKLGADATYLVQKNRAEKDVVADIHKIFEGEPNRTIDASGAEASVRLAIFVSSKILLFFIVIFITSFINIFFQLKFAMLISKAN